MGFFLLILLLCMSGRTACAEFVLADNTGQSSYSIWIASNPSPGEQLAGRELQHWLSQILGAEVPVRRGGDFPALAVVVGNRSTLVERGVLVPDLKDEGYALVPEHSRLFITGARDRATLHAVYVLLEQIGARWLAPRFDFYLGHADLVPELTSSTLRLDRPQVRHPAFRYRKLYVEEGLSHTTENLVQMVEWMPRVGYNTLVLPIDYQGSGRVKWDSWRDRLAPLLKERDLIIEVGGHGYKIYLNAKMENGRLFRDHPAWFGQDEKGRRRQGKEWVFCTSNAAAVDYVTSSVVAYLAQHPEIEIFDFWPPDGARWCCCDACVALGDPATRQALLLNQITPAIRNTRPDVRLEVIAYASYLDPPRGLRLDPGVLVDFCPINQQFTHQISDSASERNAKYTDSLARWRRGFTGDLSIYSYYRKYAWDSLPVIIPEYMQTDLQYYRSVPVQGISTYAEPGDWRTYELNHYALAKLAWDPGCDVDRLTSDYCESRYRVSGSHARDALDLLARTVRQKCSIPFTPPAPPEQLQRSARELRTAETSLRAQALSDNTSASLSALADMCEYARRDLELRHLQVTSAGEQVLRARVGELHEFLHSREGKGLFVLNRGGMRLEKLLAQYGVK